LAALNALRPLATDPTADIPPSVIDVVTAKRSGMQAAISTHIAAAAASELKALLADNARSLAALVSAAGVGAAAWLTVSPAIASSRMPDSDFRIAAAFRLHAPIPIDSLSSLNAILPEEQVCSQ